MTKTYKLTARTIRQETISQFELDDGESLDGRVQQEIDKAIVDKKLDKLATRVGLPSLAVSEIGEGENLTGGENLVAHYLYGADGAPLAERSFRTETIGHGVALTGLLDEHDEMPIGVFTSQEVADQIGVLWRNGHLSLTA